jgi:type II secretory pathway component PulK
MLVRRLPNQGRSDKRSGVVLLGVLIVIVILSLIAYQYSDRMATEFNAANNAHRNTQVRSFAASGIYFAAAVLANPDNADMLSSGIYDNDMFKDVALADGENLGGAGRFTLVAPADPTNSSGNPFRTGVTDESGKININAMMKIDPSGQALEDMLNKLPNMTPQIAASIVFWADPTATTREGAADSGYYQGLNPPYNCKNAPLDSLDELLLVQGVTRELLYGSDLNHNNLPDPSETSSSGNAIDFGWSAFLTVSSRESNRNAQGQPLIYLNDTDLQTLYQNLQAIDPNTAKFVIMYRQYGASTSTGSSQSVLGSIASLLGGGSSSTSSSSSKSSGSGSGSGTGAGSGGGTGAGNSTGGNNSNSSTSSNTVAGSLGSYTPDFTKNGGRQIASLYDLIGAMVSIPGTGQNAKTTVYTSPLSDPSTLAELFQALWLGTTTSQDAELPARINILTAPTEVLSALPVLTDGQVQTILNVRPTLASTDLQTDTYKSPAWLIAAASVTPSTLSSLDKYVTVRSSVYSVQSIGYFDSKQGPTARIEAIIDTTFGRPRIVYWRDWTELGITNVPGLISSTSGSTGGTTSSAPAGN